MSRTVVGLFDMFGDAEMALREIERLGISHDEVSIVANNANDEYSSWRNRVGDDYGTSPAGVGANTGAMVGGIGGVLLGLGLLVIPGLGPLAAAGPLVAGLTGAGVGAVAGGLLGALMNIGIPEEEAGYYAEGVRRGGTLISVNAPDSQIDQVVAVLNRNGAVDIDQRRAYYHQTGYAGYNQNAPSYTASELQAERERLRANNMLRANTVEGHVTRDRGGLDGTRTGVEGNIPGIQTGGRALDGSGAPDTRSILEKTADALTGDRIDDKTGRPV